MIIDVDSSGSQIIILYKAAIVTTITADKMLLTLPYLRPQVVSVAAGPPVLLLTLMKKKLNAALTTSRLLSTTPSSSPSLSLQKPLNPSAKTYINRSRVDLKRPQLVLIAGPTGTGKSTFSMLLSQQLGVIKCVSTDTIRLICRNYDQSPAIQRSSFNGEGGSAVGDWEESCAKLDMSINSVIDDSIKRGESLIVEGVLVRPGVDIIDRWIGKGGSALGVCITIQSEDFHRDLLIKRGRATGKGSDRQLVHFRKIREIHDEIRRLGEVSKWMVVDQEMSQADPIELALNHIKKHNT